MIFVTRLSMQAGFFMRRILGKLLEESEVSKNGHGDQRAESKGTTPLLSDYGITKDQSSTFQKIASLPEMRLFVGEIVYPDKIKKAATFLQLPSNQLITCLLSQLLLLDLNQRPSD